MLVLVLVLALVLVVVLAALGALPLGAALADAAGCLSELPLHAAISAVMRAKRRTVQ